MCIRDRSGRVYGAKSHSTPWHQLLRFLIPLIIFLGNSVMIFPNSNLSLQAHHIWGNGEEPTIEQRMTLNRKTSGEALDYVLKCDAWADGLEEGYGEPCWIPIQILDHAINRAARFDPHNRKIIYT